MNGRRHIVFIINPRSGVNRRKAIESAIGQQLDGGLFSWSIVLTEYAGHGTELAREAAAGGAWAVAAVGGDGSVNDVARGLIGSQAALVIIPMGSGNGLARTMGIPLDVAGAIALIHNGRMMAMDVGYANERLFVSNAGIGFDTVVAERFARSKSRGLLSYARLVTACLWTYRPLEYELQADGRSFRQQAFMINVANGQQFGYNFKIAAGASYTDGWLDVVIIKPFPKLLGAALVLRALRGTLAGSRYVTQLRVKEVRIAHPRLQLMQTDGDAHACAGSLHARIEPGALQVIVP